MKNAIILHGTMGSPDINWFAWLKRELEARHFRVWLPHLPNAEQPSLKEEALFVVSQCPFEIDEDTLIIGHSSGAILALVLGMGQTRRIGAVVAVSVFYDNSLGWEANDRLFDVVFDWEQMQRGVGKLLFIHSDNDPYVPLVQAEYVAGKLGQTPIVLNGQGHFNLEKGPEYRSFPRLIELLEQKGIIVGE